MSDDIGHRIAEGIERKILGIPEGVDPCIHILMEKLKQRDELEELCGTILATLRLPANQDHKLNEQADLVQSWYRRFLEITTQS